MWWGILCCGCGGVFRNGISHVYRSIIGSLKIIWAQLELDHLTVKIEPEEEYLLYPGFNWRVSDGENQERDGEKPCRGHFKIHFELENSQYQWEKDFGDLKLYHYHRIILLITEPQIEYRVTKHLGQNLPLTLRLDISSNFIL